VPFERLNFFAILCDPPRFASRFSLKMLIDANNLNPMDFPAYFFDLFFFVIGAVIGSFLNVLIHRIPRDESIVFPNSACPSCREPIKPYDNIPILSWLLLRGRCRNCRISISYRYPLVEFLTALLFVFCFRHAGFSPLLPLELTFSAAIIVLIFIDAEHMILPDAINYPGIAIAFAARIGLPAITGEAAFDDLLYAPLSNLQIPLAASSILGALLGAAAGGGVLWLLGWLWKRLRGMEGMGLGDVKMMFWVGAFLGWRLTLLTLFLAAFTGAVSGILLIYTRRDRDLQTQIPFGIFLGIGSLIALFFGNSLVNWYLTNFIPAN
jgi:leader peptidase (prepilin peptidase)/N-methyltransferase